MTAERLTVTALGACAELAEAPSGGTSCRVREFAVLSDGRELTLRADRGWASSAPLDEISVLHAVRSTYTAVLPDDAEKTGEQHEWNDFRDRLREEGIGVPVDALRALLYRVVLGLSGQEAADQPAGRA